MQLIFQLNLCRQRKSYTYGHVLVTYGVSSRWVGACLCAQVGAVMINKRFYIFSFPGLKYPITIRTYNMFDKSGLTVVKPTES